MGNDDRSPWLRECCEACDRSKPEQSLPTLYLVVSDDLPDKGSICLAPSPDVAIQRVSDARGYAPADKRSVTAICAKTAKDAHTRALLAMWERIAHDTLRQGHGLYDVEEELRRLGPLSSAVYLDHVRSVGKERDACAGAVREAMAEIQQRIRMAAIVGDPVVGLEQAHAALAKVEAAIRERDKIPA